MRIIARCILSALSGCSRGRPNPVCAWCTIGFICWLYKTQRILYGSRYMIFFDLSRMLYGTAISIGFLWCYLSVQSCHCLVKKLNRNDWIWQYYKRKGTFSVLKGCYNAPVFVNPIKVSVHNRFIIGSDSLTRLNRFAIIGALIRMKEMAVCFFVKVRP